MGGQRHAPAALLPGKTQFPLYRRLGGPQGRSGRVRKISPPPTGIQSPDRPARSQSLYRLSYRGRTVIDKNSVTALLCVVWNWPELKQRTEKHEFCKSTARRGGFSPPCLMDKRWPDARSASVRVCSLWPFQDIKNVQPLRTVCLYLA